MNVADYFLNFSINQNIDNQFQNITWKLRPVHYVAICLYTIYGFVAIVGNVVLIIAMARARLLQTGGYLTLAHFAVTDVITGLSIILFLPWSILLQRNIFPDFLPGLLLSYGAFSRKVFMAFMAGVMFCSILFPFSARRFMSLGWYHKALILTWVISCFVSLPYWIGRGHYVDPANYRWGMNVRNFTPIYGLSVNFTVTAIILFVYPLCFFKIIQSNGHRQELQCGRGSSGSVTCSVITNRERLLLLLFTLNSVIFILYWIPIYLCEFFDLTVPYYSLWKETMRGILISYTPFAYCIIHKGIREAIVNLILCQKQVEKISLSAVHSIHMATPERH